MVSCINITNWVVYDGDVWLIQHVVVAVTELKCNQYQPGQMLTAKK